MLFSSYAHSIPSLFSASHLFITISTVCSNKYVAWKYLYHKCNKQFLTTYRCVFVFIYVFTKLFSLSKRLLRTESKQLYRGLNECVGVYNSNSSISIYVRLRVQTITAWFLAASNSITCKNCVYAIFWNGLEKCILEINTLCECGCMYERARVRVCSGE